MEEMSEFLQQSLEKDFHYEDDVVIEQLQVCQEELRKAKMDMPPKARNNESPKLPFGLEIEPSVEQLIGKRTAESIDEHFRRNPRGGKAAYLRKKNMNNLGTPEMSRSRGDTRSLHSRLSDYSIDDRSSYYDTAANSRLSLADQSRASIPSSRTSFADTSEMGSMTLTYGGVPAFPEDVNGADVTTPTTPTPGGITTPTPMTASSTFHQDGGAEMMEIEQGAHSPGSGNSDYDNVNGMYDEAPPNIIINTPAAIPISKSDGFVDSRTSTVESETFVSNGHDGHISSRMKTTMTENDIQQARFYDATESSQREHQNGVVIDRHVSHQVASSMTTHTRTVYSRQVERSSYMWQHCVHSSQTQNVSVLVPVLYWCTQFLSVHARMWLKTTLCSTEFFSCRELYKGAVYIMWD